MDCGWAFVAAGLAPGLADACLSTPAVDEDLGLKASRRKLGSESCTGRSNDTPLGETSACDEDPTALTGIIEVLSVESPPILICVEILLDVLSSVEGRKLIGPDDSLETKDVVASLEADKITDDETIELKEFEMLLKELV